MADSDRGRGTPRRGRRLTRRDKGKAKIGEPIDLTPNDDDNEEQQGSPINLTADDGNEEQKSVIDLIPDDDNEQQGSPVNLSPEDEDNEQQSFPPEDSCFTRILTSEDVDHLDPRIKIDSFQAMNLTGNPDLLELPASGNFLTTLSVFDDDLRIYDLVLSDFATSDWVGYSISGDWGLFVRFHQLAVGDRIDFYRKYDPSSTIPLYDLNFVRKHVQYVPMTGLTDHIPLNVIPLDADYISQWPPAEDWPPNRVNWSPEEYSPPEENWSPEHKSPDRKKKPGPGSRVLSDDTIVLSQILEERGVIHDGENPILLLSADKAGMLIGCPCIEDYYSQSILLENLLVFDTDDKQYDMLLSLCAFKKGSYCIDAGWQRFVEVHNLKIDDIVIFHRLIDDTVYDEPYYVVKYIRKELPGGSGTSGVDPSGTGVSPGVIEAEPSGTGVTPGVIEADLSGNEVSPGVIEADPSGTEVSPGVIEAEPSGTGVSLGVIEADPSGKEVSPDVIEADPSGTEVSPGVIEADPSGTGVSPSGSTVSEVDPRGSDHKEES